MIKKMISNQHNRRRLIRFNLLRQQLCPLCGDIVCFDNKKKFYVCRNTQCEFKEEKENLTEINSKEDIVSNL